MRIRNFFLAAIALRCWLVRSFLRTPAGHHRHHVIITTSRFLNQLPQARPWWPGLSFEAGRFCDCKYWCTVSCGDIQGLGGAHRNGMRPP